MSGGFYRSCRSSIVQLKSDCKPAFRQAHSNRPRWAASRRPAGRWGLHAPATAGGLLSFAFFRKPSHKETTMTRRPFALLAISCSAFVVSPAQESAPPKQV